MRVVVYGEGGRELGEVGSARASPGETLPEDSLGAAHWLVRRGLEAVQGVALAATSFEEPLRARARRSKGSNLLHRPTLRELLTWLPTKTRTRCPDLAVVFVDADGDSSRRQTLLKSIEGMPPLPARVIAVPVREFEAWLISDWSCVQQMLGLTRDLPPAPEGFKPGEAKRLFAELFAASSRKDESGVRRDLAKHCDLEQVRGRSQSFGRFLDDLA